MSIFIFAPILYNAGKNNNVLCNNNGKDEKHLDNDKKLIYYYNE